MFISTSKVITSSDRKGRQTDRAIREPGWVIAIEAIGAKAVLIARNAALRAGNQHQKKKRVRKTGAIQKGGSIAVNHT